MGDPGAPVQERGPEKSASSPAPDRRLTRDRRLVRSPLFKEAFDTGRKFPGRFMVMWIRESPDTGLRAGVVAAKKSFPKAVERSRAKRLLREAFRLNRFRLIEGRDLVLLARRSILDAKCAQVEADLMALVGKAGIRKGE